MAGWCGRNPSLRIAHPRRLARNPPILQDTASNGGQPAQSTAKIGIVPVADDVQSDDNDLTVHRQRARTWLQASLSSPRWEDRVDFAELGRAAKRDLERKLPVARSTGIIRDLTRHRRLRRIRAAGAPVYGAAAQAAPADMALR